MTMFLSQVILIILSIKSRFAALNFLLKSKTCIDIHQLKIVSKIHHALTDIIEAINKSYCTVTLFIFAGVFGFFNLFLFSLRIMIEFFNLACFIIFTGKVLINAYSFVTTMFVIFVSSKATNEAKKTLRVLYELSHKSEYDAEWNAQFLSFAGQIDCSVTKFSCGFFTFDWQLFFKAS
jgi:7tm Chemosensory receptor